jgi:hypothetical protein
MSRGPERKLSLTTVSMIIVVTTFGFSNVIDNLVDTWALKLMMRQNWMSRRRCNWSVAVVL